MNDIIKDYSARRWVVYGPDGTPAFLATTRKRAREMAAKYGSGYRVRRPRITAVLHD